MYKWHDDWPMPTFMVVVIIMTTTMNVGIGQSSCHLYMAFQLLKEHGKWSYESIKETGHVFYMATPSTSHREYGSLLHKSQLIQLKVR